MIVKEADLRHPDFYVKPLFRGFSKDDPKKVICIHKAPEGNIKKFVQAKSEWIKIQKKLIKNYFCIFNFEEYFKFTM